MLASKKISKKKQMTNYALVFVMLTGTIFFLYKNYSLTSHKDVDIIYTEEEMEGELGMEELMEAESLLLEEEDEAIITSEETATENEPNSLFETEKFKELKKNVVKDSSFEVGKDNPFEED